VINHDGSRRGPRYRPQRVPGRRLGRVAGTVGEYRSRTYGEALVTGPASRASCPASGRCVGEDHYRGAERTGGFRGVAPRASTVGEDHYRGAERSGGFRGVAPPGLAQFDGGAYAGYTFGSDGVPS
jgi:hypothetical protein